MQLIQLPNKNKLKTIDVVVLVDNRNNQESSLKSNSLDFRGSAFKQTQIDPLEPKSDFVIAEDELFLFNLKKKIQQLENRVVKLENENANEQKDQKRADLNKKKRRKFCELLRNHQCPYMECQKIYGSETSLKYHLREKHKQIHKNY